MIEMPDDLYQLMFDIQLAYAFQDVEKNHNPIKNNIIIFQNNSMCDQIYIYNFIVIYNLNCKRLFINHHFTHVCFLFL